MAKPSQYGQPLNFGLVFPRPAHALTEIMCRRTWSHGRNIRNTLTLPSQVRPGCKHLRAEFASTIMISIWNATHPGRRNHRTKQDRSGGAIASIQECAQPGKVNLLRSAANVSIRSTPGLCFVPSALCPLFQGGSTPHFTQLMCTTSNAVFCSCSRDFKAKITDRVVPAPGPFFLPCIIL